MEKKVQLNLSQVTIKNQTKTHCKAIAHTVEIEKHAENVCVSFLQCFSISIMESYCLEYLQAVVTLVR